jgi:hypothetical protein
MRKERIKSICANGQELFDVRFGVSVEVAHIHEVRRDWNVGATCDWISEKNTRVVSAIQPPERHDAIRGWVVGDLGQHLTDGAKTVRKHRGGDGHRGLRCPCAHETALAGVQRATKGAGFHG